MLSSRQVRMRPTWLAIFLIPFVVTPVVAGVAWRFFMWQQEFGVINQVLGAPGGPDPYWLLERETALIAAIVSNSWHLTPLAILVFYAALTTIPDELYDAGKTDGASPMQSLWYIVLPMLRPHMLFVSIIIMWCWSGPPAAASRPCSVSSPASRRSVGAKSPSTAEL